MIKKTLSIIAASMIVSASCELPKTILIPSDKLNDLDYISNNINKTFDKKIIQDIKRITANCNMGVESSINKFKTQISTNFKYYQTIENNKDIHTLQAKIKIKQKAISEAKKIMEKQLKSIAISDTFMITLKNIGAFDSKNKLQKKAENAIFSKAVENLSSIYLETITTIENVTVKDIIKQHISGKVMIDNTYLSKIDRANKTFFYIAKVKVLPLEKAIDNKTSKSTLEAFQITPTRNQNKIPKKYQKEVENIFTKYYQSIQNQNDLSVNSQNDIISTYENTVEDNNYEIKRIERDIKRIKKKLNAMYSKIGFECDDDYVQCNKTAQKKIIKKIQKLSNDILNTKSKELIYKTTYVETESDNPTKGIAKQVNSVVKQTIQTYSKVQSLSMDTIVVNNTIIKDTTKVNKEFYRDLDKFYIYPVPAYGNGFDLVIVNKFNMNNTKQVSVPSKYTNHNIKEIKQKKEPKVETYNLTINTNPSDAKVQITNIKPKYYDGIKLKKGNYKLKISKNGYKTFIGYVDHTDNNIYTVSLEKVTRSYSSNSSTIKDREGNIYKTITSSKTKRVWLDRNLGASRVCQSFDDKRCYGDYYQWGRDADGHEKSNSSTTSTQATSTSSVGHSKFITSSKSHKYDWARDADRSGATRSTNWNPCPTGYRVPTIEELKAENISNRSDAYSKLKLPSAGNRNYSSGSLYGQGSYGNVWSSSVDGSFSRYLHFNSSFAYNFSYNRAYGQSVRCLREE